MNPLLCTYLGRISYSRAIDLMDRTVDEVAGGAPPQLLLLEHEPVVTLGRRADLEHLLCSAQTLAAEGIELTETSRGGDITFHGPGQLVGYPILPVGRMVRRHVERIFGTLEDLLLEAGITSSFDSENPGLWVDQRKIAAVGIEIRQGVSLHGFCLNVRRAHDGFRHIVPCGLVGRGIVYWSELGAAPTVPETAHAFAGRFAARCGLTPVFEDDRPFSTDAE
ncbi:lipoyl(octanoyl) transferase LipB [Myxococcota bacterium]|nr:lipoyl(octanoyl) transferase LipB [Myxococcota bacterium]